MDRVLLLIFLLHLWFLSCGAQTTQCPNLLPQINADSLKNISITNEGFQISIASPFQGWSQTVNSKIKLIVPSLLQANDKNYFCAELFENSSQEVYFSTDFNSANLNYFRQFSFSRETQLQLSFFYINEFKVGPASQIINVRWNNNSILAEAFSDCSLQYFIANVTAIGGLNKLQFSGDGVADNSGILFKDVSLRSIMNNTLPAPNNGTNSNASANSADKYTDTQKFFAISAKYTIVVTKITPNIISLQFSYLLILIDIERYGLYCYSTQQHADTLKLLCTQVSRADEISGSIKDRILLLIGINRQDLLHYFPQTLTMSQFLDNKEEKSVLQIFYFLIPEQIIPIVISVIQYILSYVCYYCSTQKKYKQFFIKSQKIWYHLVVSLFYLETTRYTMIFLSLVQNAEMTWQSVLLIIYVFLILALIVISSPLVYSSSKNKTGHEQARLHLENIRNVDFFIMCYYTYIYVISSILLGIFYYCFEQSPILKYVLVFVVELISIVLMICAFHARNIHQNNAIALIQLLQTVLRALFSLVCLLEMDNKAKPAASILQIILLCFVFILWISNVCITFYEFVVFMKELSQKKLQVLQKFLPKYRCSFLCGCFLCFQKQITNKVQNENEKPMNQNAPQANIAQQIIQVPSDEPATAVMRRQQVQDEVQSAIKPNPNRENHQLKRRNGMIVADGEKNIFAQDQQQDCCEERSQNHKKKLIKEDVQSLKSHKQQAEVPQTEKKENRNNRFQQIKEQSRQQKFEISRLEIEKPNIFACLDNEALEQTIQKIKSEHFNFHKKHEKIHQEPNQNHKIAQEAKENHDKIDRESKQNNKKKQRSHYRRYKNYEGQEDKFKPYRRT